MSFISDLKAWKKTEREFAKLLLDCPDVTRIEFPEWKSKERDIRVMKWCEIITYEIKTDFKADETWNFVIETRFNWKASWIYASKADYIVYYILWKRYIQERWELILRLINCEKRETKWWDWYKSELYVISIDNLPNLFNTITTEDVQW